MSHFKLETLRGGKWLVEYEGEDAVAYATAVLAAAVDARSTRATSVALLGEDVDPEGAA
ncbi:hypothetical protein SEA_BOLT007_69 [Arthrobacter phage Bolt007]|uniref:Uncharacterized protein n=1 Tax=Arthrobacter phage Bolt007 TaxID=3017297 RepID=A0AA49E480_9CAUD|nr:hypothetical protein SEA_BOLT007_69 [Arthrobacter phage Bolt007]